MLFMTLTLLLLNFCVSFEFWKFFVLFEVLSIYLIRERSLMLLIGVRFIDLSLLFIASAFYDFDTNCFQ